MDDLISRKALLSEINNTDSPYFIDIVIQDADTNKDIIDKTLTAYRKILIQMINDIPTVYDVDRVISAINSHIEAWEDKSFLRRDIAEEHIKAWKSALCIVKGAAKDE